MEENKELNHSEESEVKATTDVAAASAEKPQNKGNAFHQKGGNKNFSKGPRRNDIVKEFEEKIIKISRVTKVVKGGKRMRFSALVVIGDHKGRFGYGLGKSNEVPDAIKKAVAGANKDLHKVSLVKGTITHTIVGKYGATEVYLKPAPEGTGLVAGGAVRAILELTGVKNVYSKIYGSRTQSNVVKATIDALDKLKSYPEVALVRYGKDVSKKETSTKEDSSK